MPREEQQKQPDQQEPRHFEPFTSRWYAPGRPQQDVEPPEYVLNTPGNPFNPYRQNVLKGDYPILGTEDLFFAFTATNRLVVQFRNVPTPSGISGAGNVPESFFGEGQQLAVIDDLAFTFDLFKGQQAFKPVDWRLRVSPVFNVEHLNVEEAGVVNVSVADGDTRTTTDFALQEALFEYHLLDLGDRYDFLSIEGGILPFRSDFRGFVFDDTNLGVRLFGNADDNKWQYNVVYFNMLDKDTNSLLNTFDDRDQDVFIVNVYRQDWPFLGYTPSLSFHYNRDRRGLHFDDNGFLVSPAPIGLAQPNEIDAYYVGFTGQGRLGRINVTHAFYQVLGKESENAIAARQVDINAQLAALELSYDIDWLRPRVFALYASGDDDPRDGDGEGFDAILDAPNFAGGPLSFFNSQALKLLGTNLTNVQSPLPDLQTSKFEGQSNFVNPGLMQFGGALDIELTPKWRAEIGGSYLRFVETAPLEVFLEIPDVDRSIGFEVFVGTQFRPLLTNNVIFQVSAAALFPDEGWTRLFESSETAFAVTTTVLTTW